MLSASEAFEAYEAVRHRLPPATASEQPYRHAETLSELANAYDVFLLDAFGVLNIGEHAIPGTADRVQQLRSMGKRVLVVSNAASVPTHALQQKYHRLGYDFDLDDIVTSRATMIADLKTRAAKAWGAMVRTDALLDDFEGVSIAVLQDDPQLYDQVEGFLLIGSGTWTEHRQMLLEASLRANPRPVLVANPDIVAPRENGFSTEPGNYAHRLADLTPDPPQFFGKPFLNIYELALARLGPVDRRRILMVGDSLHTDILGAQTAGISSALVSHYGLFAGQNVRRAITESGIVPTYVIDRP